MRRFFRLIGFIVRMATIAVAIVAIATLLLLGMGSRSGAYQIRTVLTGSMRPTMPEGSVVMLRPVSPGNLRVGDVITYRIPVGDRRIVTHRIIEITEPGAQPVVRTQGDANHAPDPWVARLRGDQAWRVQLSVRGVGYALASLRRPAAQRLTVVVTPALLAVASVVRIWLPAKADVASPEVDVPKEPPLRTARKVPKEPRPHRPLPLRRSHHRPRNRHRRPPPEPTQEERWQEWRERRVRQHAVGPRLHA